MKPLLRKWLERIDAPEITRGMILQLQTCILPRAMGYERAGRPLSLDARECEVVLGWLEKRVNEDGGPKVTEKQAKFGRHWCATTGVKQGMPKVDYDAIECFRLADVIAVDENTYRAICAPVYDAYFTDGSVLRYHTLAWINGGGVDWHWKKQPQKGAA